MGENTCIRPASKVLQCERGAYPARKWCTLQHVGVGPNGLVLGANASAARAMVSDDDVYAVAFCEEPNSPFTFDL